MLSEYDKAGRRLSGHGVILKPYTCLGGSDNGSRVYLLDEEKVVGAARLG